MSMQTITDWMVLALVAERAAIYIQQIILKWRYKRLKAQYDKLTGELGDKCDDARFQVELLLADGVSEKFESYVDKHADNPITSAMMLQELYQKFGILLENAMTSKTRAKLDALVASQGADSKEEVARRNKALKDALETARDDMQLVGIDMAPLELRYAE